MPALMELKQQHAAALAKADSIIAAAERAGRPLTPEEDRDSTAAITEAQQLQPQIAAVEKKNTLLGMMRNGQLIPASKGALTTPGKRTLSTEYQKDFFAWIASGGENMGAALYEGAGPAGGYAVPIVVDDQIVPLAPAETGLRQLATVLPTSGNIQVPRKTAVGTAGSKAETGASTNNFVETTPTLDEFTLSAFMAGAYERISFELAQDVPSFQAFVVADLLNAQQQFEEAWYVSGTGNGQPQGLLGNVGAGVTEEPDANGNLVSIDGTLDLTGALNAVYHANASFLMSRPTSIVIRKAQRQANLFEPVWTSSNGKDYLHGYPVGYSAAMPTAARGATPVMFGDFRQGYVIGDRGGSAINIKILDQPFAVQGQIAVLAYRRTDGRVRRSEAIQSYNVAAS